MEKIKRITTEQFMDLLFKKARDSGRLGDSFFFEGKEIYTEYTSSRNFSRDNPELSNYEWDLEAYPEFGGSEGIYANIFISGRRLEGQEKPGREHAGTIKSLNSDLATMEALGCCCGTISFFSRFFAEGMIGRLSPKTEIEKELAYAKERGKKSFFFPFLSDEDNTLTNERGYVLCYASEARYAEEWFLQSIYKGCKTKCHSKEQFKEIRTDLPWLDYVIVR